MQPVLICVGRQECHHCSYSSCSSKLKGNLVRSHKFLSYSLYSSKQKRRRVAIILVLTRLQQSFAPKLQRPPPPPPVGQADPSEHQDCGLLGNEYEKQFNQLFSRLSCFIIYMRKYPTINLLSLELLEHSTRHRAPPCTRLSLFDRKTALMKPVDVTFGFIPEQYLVRT